MYPPVIQRQLAEIPEFEGDLSSTQRALVAVNVGKQVLTLYQPMHAEISYPVSTSRYGVGSLQDSFCTPLGLHEIAEKIGAGRELGEIFISRQPQGCIYSTADAGGKKDVISSRILWLRGLQPGINQGGRCDSYRRYIYIHGTADEARIGQIASIGCIRMLNSDVVALFERVETSCRVLIYR
jgi:lipoprotein-anchoring transpeptidase ErfK/SrfK